MAWPDQIIVNFSGDTERVVPLYDYEEGVFYEYLLDLGGNRYIDIVADSGSCTVQDVDYDEGFYFNGSETEWQPTTVTNDAVDPPSYGGIATIDWTGKPAKPVNPTPTHEATDVTLDQTTVTWEDGGGATSYNIYQGVTSGSLALVESGVTDLSYVLRSTNWPTYGQNRYWRVDAVNDSGVTTGDEWKFTTLIFLPPTPGGITWDDPGNDEGYTGTPTGENNMTTIKRLIAAANNRIWYET